MTAAQRDIYIEAGATFRSGFTWHRAGPPDSRGRPTPGEPYDLTGWSARMQVRQAIDSPAVLTATTTNQMIVFGRDPADPSAAVDLTNGRVDIVLTDEQTLVLNPLTTGRYDLLMEDPQGARYRLLQGSVTIDPGVTREGP